MNDAEKYHKWVEWSAEDATYIGKCPDLMTGIHGDDPVTVYGELCAVIEAVIKDLKRQGRPLPATRIRPMMDVA